MTHACVSFIRIESDPEKLNPLSFTLALFLLFCGMEMALYLVRDAPGRFGQNLLIYAREEVYYDAVRIESVRDCLR